MNITRNNLSAAANEGLLRHEQVEPLLAFLLRDLSAKPADAPRFNGTHILYYLGGLLAIGAASLFTTLAVESLGMMALLGLAIAYAVVATVAAAHFEQRGITVPASIMATLAVALTPLWVFALQHVLGFWSYGGDAQHYQDFHRWMDWRWIAMELATLLAGAIMLKRFRYPFLVMPIALTLWYMGMDLIPMLMQSAEGSDWFSGPGFEFRKIISLVFGLIMLLIAFFVDLRSRYSKDYAFWLYLFGLLTFCGALSMMRSGAISGKLIYLVLHFGLVFIGALLSRRTFAVFGGIGILMVLGDLSRGVFKDSFAFVAVLTILGFALIGVGVWWSRYESMISSRIRSILPADLSESLEALSQRVE